MEYLVDGLEKEAKEMNELAARHNNHLAKEYSQFANGLEWAVKRIMEVSIAGKFAK